MALPNDGRWEEECTKLYSRIKDVLQAARTGPDVIDGWIGMSLG
jgi:hypothetical protein